MRCLTQGYGLEGAKMDEANERASTSKLASLDATLDDDLRRAFEPCPLSWVVGRTSGVRSMVFSSFIRTLPVSAVMCPKRAPPDHSAPRILAALPLVAMASPTLCRTGRSKHPAAPRR